MPTYGLPYMGSKNGIIKFIYKNLPSGKRLVDLFGGGGAITHYVILKNQDLIKKYESFYYNDYCYDIYKLFKDCISGEIKNNPYYNKWISREEFFELKDKEPLIKYCWSFGNKGRSYLYCFEKENYRKALFYSKVYNDVSLFKEMDIILPSYDNRTIINNQEYIKKQYIKWFLKKYYNVEEYVQELFSDLSNRLQSMESLKRPELLQGLTSLKRLERLEGLVRLERLEIDNISYLDYQYQDGDVVYCDPPYENTEQYNKVVFNSQEFYDWVATRPYQVFFSSYKISDNRFKIVDKIEKDSLLSGLGRGKKVIEYIYSNYQ